jgi:hypothetical protein
MSAVAARRSGNRALGEVGAETGEPAGRWVDNDGSRSVTLGDQLTGKQGEGLRISMPAAGGQYCAPAS